MLKEVSSYDFTASQEFKLMDRAIERLAEQSRHLKIAKCQLLRQHGRIVESRNLLDKLKQGIPNITEDLSSKVTLNVLKFTFAATNREY